MSQTSGSFKSGFVAIAGPPNVGKSTLLNRLLGEKISITSQKPQTTRNRILGVLHLDNAQCIFIDTPGIFKASGPLNTRIVEVAVSTLTEVDIILLLVDAARSDTAEYEMLINAIKNIHKPVILALNKIDQVKKKDLLAIMAHWQAVFAFTEIIPVSAKTGEQAGTLVALLQKQLPPGPRFYPEDSITDVSERFIAAELVREKVFRLTGQEVPHAVAVTIDRFKEKKDASIVHIHATIHVERDSQKGIIIGKGGTKLKSIGAAARKSIEELLGTKVFLKLFVRVEKNWSKDTKALRRFGY